jgi:hypothetical protein
MLIIKLKEVDKEVKANTIKIITHLRLNLMIPIKNKIIEKTLKVQRM